MSEVAEDLQARRTSNSMADLSASVHTNRSYAYPAPEPMLDHPEFSKVKRLPS